ncbi:MAG: large conductance mechanosensitive channel protein MscL [Clostridia bacterium]|nr:large conductance mechanosensitive channel protein MscL [Clostridia bacterium]
MAKKVKDTAKELKKKGDGFWADFKKFITKGNVLDMAVAVVVATAFNAIVNGLVKYIITPLITYATSGVSINEWEWVVREEVLDAAGAVVTSKISVQYGLWLQAIVDFLIIAFSVFVVVRVIRNAERALNAKELAKQAEEAAAKKAEDDKKAAEAAAAAKAAADAQKAREDAFLADVKEQAELLREIRDSLKKQ